MHTLKITMKGLLSQKTKTTLTAIATMCATAIITCLIAFFHTATRQMTEEMQTIQKDSRISLQIHSSDKKESQINYKDYLATIKPQFKNNHIAAAKKSYISIFLDDKNTRRDYFEHVICDYAYLEANNLSLHSGRFFDPLESPLNNFVVIGSEVAKLTLHNSIEQETPSLFIHKKKHTILGILEQQNDQAFFTRPNANKTIYTHIQTSPGQHVSVDEITIQVKNTQESQAINAQIKEVLQIHFPKVRYQVIDTTQTAKQIETYINKIQFVLASFGIISTLIASINITNNMYAIITERFQEIGIRLAIGATAQQIKKLLLAETILLATLSAAVGVIAGELLNMFLITYLNWDYQFYAYSGLLSFIMMNIVSIVSCYLPLRKVDTLNPIKAIQSL